MDTYSNNALYGRYVGVVNRSQKATTEGLAMKVAHSEEKKVIHLPPCDDNLTSINADSTINQTPI